MTPISQFYPFVVPWVDGCPTPAIDIAIRRSAIKFCTETPIWQEESDPIPVVIGEPEYSLSISSSSVVGVVLDLWLDGVRLKPTTKDALSLNHGEWITKTGTPSAYFLTANKVVRLFPIPVVDGSMLASISLAPSSNASNLEDFLFNDWQEVISSGALAWLMAMPGVPWSNPDLSIYHARIFSDAIGVARIATARQFTRDQQYVQPRVLV